MRLLALMCLSQVEGVIQRLTSLLSSGIQQIKFIVQTCHRYLRRTVQPGHLKKTTLVKTLCVINFVPR